MRIHFSASKTYWLVGKDGKPYPSQTPGKWGGHRKLKIYGRLDCPSALRWIDKGFYTPNRVFFKSKYDAQQAGYRPCGTCLPGAYQKWKATRAPRFSRMI